MAGDIKTDTAKGIGGITVQVDTAEAKELVDALTAELGPAGMRRRWYRIFQRMGGHVRKILNDQLPKKYHVKGAGKVVGSPKISGSTSVQCAIPLKDKRGTIGGGFKAYGGTTIRKSKLRGRIVKHSDITADIVKSGRSALPGTMGSYGGQPPFRNGGVVFTRSGPDRKSKLRAVKGISIVQMPMTRSRADVEQDLQKYLIKELEDNLRFELTGSSKAKS